MPTTVEWQDIALRLALTLLAGALIGWDRGVHGRPAGLRTTILVCLAASVAMIQTNLLLMSEGRPKDSFIMLDLMRLPLGILSGMGFIGGGVILKRDDLVLGVTTAATLWFVTVLGLCFGGGQHVLGLAGLGIGMVVLKTLKRLEERLPQDFRATLVVNATASGPTEADVRREAAAASMRIISSGMVLDKSQETRELCCELRWRGLASEDRQTPFVESLAQWPGVSRVQWTPRGLPAASS
ncbi:MAG: MgtC/SapB family protein [Isosphaeraceae bacterium]|nr:MgtC/SapB family protein [Isosphaeraceae bacterium]